MEKTKAVNERLVGEPDHFFSTLIGKLVFISLPNDKILDWSRLKAFADENFNITKTMISVCGRVENIVGKMLVISIFLFSHNVFKSFLFQGR